MNKKLFVGNLAYRISEDQLSELFRQAGSVTSVKIITDPYTGRSKGFGFVEMASEDEAAAAKRMFGGYSFHERPLVVDEARPPRGGRDRERASR